jgi:hypothetical protein
MTDAQTDREVIEQRLRHVRALAQMLDAMFGTFLQARVSKQWASVGLHEMREWIKARSSTQPVKAG